MSWREDDAADIDRHLPQDGDNAEGRRLEDRLGFHTVGRLEKAGLGSRSKLLAEIRAGKLKARRFGRVLIVTDEGLREFLAALPEAATPADIAAEELKNRNRQWLSARVRIGKIPAPRVPVSRLSDAAVLKLLNEYRHVP